MAKTRDELRTIAFKSAPQRREVVEFGGAKYELLQPLVGDREKIIAKATDDQGKMNNSKFLIWTAILLAVVPGTDERIFEEADFDAFWNMTSGGFADKTAEVIGKLLNVDLDEKKV